MIEELLAELKKMGNPDNKAGMARFGIETKNALGISVTTLRAFAKPYRKNHPLALELWQTSIHEARILATIIDDPKQVTEEQMESWVQGFDSWDTCDQACTGLFDKTPFAHQKAIDWSTRKPEFEKRAGFSLMAGMAWHLKDEPDTTFITFLPHIVREAIDERNFVKKAVNWALRGIGKRNLLLCEKALETAQEIKKIDSKAAHWIAQDAIRELEHYKEKTLKRRDQADSSRLKARP